MEKFSRELQIRWSDLDPNGHLRHSVYYDWGTFCRISFFEHHQLSYNSLIDMNIGIVSFREECVFRKEIRLGDKVTIELELVKARRDFSRWSIRHNIFKNGDTLAAILTFDGAWIDLNKRKLTIPGGIVVNAFSLLPQAADFNWTE